MQSMAHQMLYPYTGHFRRDPWEAYFGRPLRLFNQHFGTGLLDDDLLPIDTPIPAAWSLMQRLSLSPQSHRVQYIPKETGVSEITYDSDKFEVKLDVHQFLPEELSVKMTDQYVVVEGHHEEKEDPHGLISRHFVRKYLLPENAKDDEVLVNLSSDGVLQIGVPRKLEAHHDPKAKALKIHMTGRPAIASGGIKDKGHKFHGLANGDGMKNGENIPIKKIKTDVEEKPKILK